MITRKKKPTLKDITELAGCSLAVASTILNDQHSTIRYSEELAQRVRQSAQKLGYHARQRKPQLYKPHRGVIDVGSHLPVGVIIHPFKSSVDGMESIFMEQLSRQLERFNVTQQIIYANDEFHVARLRERVRRKDLGAAVTFVMGIEDNTQGTFEDANLPTVMVNPHKVPSHNAILPDDEQGVNQACDFLTLIGAKRVLYVVKRTVHYSGELRQKKLQSRFKAMAVQMVGEFDHTNLSKQPLSRLVKRHRVDTIVTYNNVMARRVIKILEQMQMKVPEDMNVLSLAGLPNAHHEKSVTQIAIPFDHMGRIAADMCIDMIKHKQVKFKNVLVPEYLKIGTTCRRV